MLYLPPTDAKGRPAPYDLADRSVAYARLARAAVGLVFGVEPDAMLTQSRSFARVAEARQAAMYLTHVVFGLHHGEVGRVFLRDRTTSSHACRLVEDRRDDADYDANLKIIEAALGLLPRPMPPRAGAGR